MEVEEIIDLLLDRRVVGTLRKLKIRTGRDLRELDIKTARNAVTGCGSRTIKKLLQLQKELLNDMPY